MEPRRSLGWPILLGILLIGSILALGVGWVLVSIAAALSSENAAFYWAILGVGVTLLVAVLVGVIVYLLLTVKAIALSQRQSNFIDSVTHELKSPIASLKLYLQTLTRRQVSPQQQEEFHRFMLADVQRLDTLIDHLLDAAKTLHRRPAASRDEIALEELLTPIAAAVAQRHGVEDACIRLHVGDAGVRGRQADLEIVFRNLIDNAVKYSLPKPEVEITAEVAPKSMLAVTISDRGPGVPAMARKRIFGRFVRLGSELERSTPGTGLGLFLVRAIVRHLRGRVSVHAGADGVGTRFVVLLPAAVGAGQAETGDQGEGLEPSH
ncbi:MAG: HAMP domain-containing histidine kinase [Pirellulales bacterium]|nr:HAMP domain-containing histidine kinase [Pirellulales bacterium]